jgi:hypothetical protein
VAAMNQMKLKANVEKTRMADVGIKKLMKTSRRCTCENKNCSLKKKVPPSIQISESGNNNQAKLDKVYDRQKICIIDIQHVIGSHGEKFVKEMVLLSTNSVQADHYLFLPPYGEEQLDLSAIRQNNYLCENVNGLSWIDGTISYLEVKNILNAVKDKIIIVKGHEKMKFLSKYLKTTNIVDLDIEGGLQNIKDYYHRCSLHYYNYRRCATNICFKLLFFMENNNMLV